MKSLEEVSMPDNKITLKGITALADAFAQNPNLRSIDIGGNAIQAEGVSEIAKVGVAVIFLWNDEFHFTSFHWSYVILSIQYM